MNRIVIAQELIKVARELLASSIHVGDICRMDRKKALRGDRGGTESAKMVNRIWDMSSGWVEVLEVNGSMAKITQRQNGSGSAKLMTSVPIDALDNTMKRFDNPQELGKALDLDVSTVLAFLNKGDFPVMQGDMNWRYLLNEKKNSRQIVDNNDRRDSGPEL
jgi:hypothetical protein